MRESAVLMPISSLPSNGYIGSFSLAAYRFAELIKKAGFSCWQILPLNPLGYGNSPYQPLSSNAIDEIYLSLEELKNDGLIDDYPKFNSPTVNYDAARKMKREALQEAFKRFEVNDEYRNFTTLAWVQEYAIFVTMRELEGHKCWTSWRKEFIDFGINRNPDVIKPYLHIIAYHIFAQYILLKQFKKLKAYLSKLNIKLIGDVPFYVGLDSSDVYFNRQCFLLDDKGNPTKVAGVPPDYFSKTGQRWGNPIYDWNYLKTHNYQFLLDRLAYNSELYDILRLDHFRAYDTYYQIEAKEDTAINGEWVINDGYNFFNELYKQYPSIELIAEDLGDIREEVRTLRDYYHLARMHVLEFEMFKPSINNEIVYIGTHDNESFIAWYKALDFDTKNRLHKLFKISNEKDIVDQCIDYALSLKAKLVIISIIDLLKENKRINTPGTTFSPNWEYRIKDYQLLEKRLKKIRRLNQKRGRHG